MARLKGLEPLTYWFVVKLMPFFIVAYRIKTLGARLFFRLPFFTSLCVVLSFGAQFREFVRQKCAKPSTCYVNNIMRLSPYTPEKKETREIWTSRVSLC